MASIREKPHRLPKEFYRGRSIVAFTLFLKNRATIFKNPDLVDIFILHGPFEIDFGSRRL